MIAGVDPVNYLFPIVFCAIIIAVIIGYTSYKSVNGKLKGYVEGKGTTIHFPAEMTDEVGDVEIREIED